MKKQQHYFHLVALSPWPLYTSISLFFLTLSFASFLHFYNLSNLLLIFSLIILIHCLYFWWNDIIIEGTYLGCHTLIVQQGLRYGVFLFILSEIMFFFSFFWAFFHSSLVPNIEIGCIWPPAEIKVFNPWGVPLVNTILLLTSGCTVTLAHYFICKEIWNVLYTFNKVKKTLNIIYTLNNHKYFSTLSLLWTILLAILFTGFQIFEYSISPFTILDGIYGSTFFMLTGFHGLHVIIGTIFLIVSFLRNIFRHFTSNHHLGFESAAWYWHFVDVIWLLLFIVIYCWGGF